MLHFARCVQDQVGTAHALHAGEGSQSAAGRVGRRILNVSALTHTATVCAGVVACRCISGRALTPVLSLCLRSCLAHVLSAACDPTAQKRMFFGFDMVYVDESAIMVGTEQEVSNTGNTK